MNNAEKTCVGVIFGGRSGEHEVSLASARNVMDALRLAGYQVAPIGIMRTGRWLTRDDPWARLADHTAGSLTEHTDDAETALTETEHKDTPADGWALLPHTDENRQLAAIDVIFPVLHGPYGEDGTVQGLLEMANLPYVGCGVLASAVAMDKVTAKKLFAAEGLRQTSYRVVLRTAWRGDPDSVLTGLTEALDYPLFVKPANMGSSVGVSKAQDDAELAAALDMASQYDRKIVVEEAVPAAREIEVSVLGNCGSTDHAPIASVPGEIVPGGAFYDYAAKYQDDTSRLIIPAELSDEQTAGVQAMALRAFHAIDGTGLARVDFLLDGRDGTLYLNEVNTMPGFTQISMYPKLWEASGISYPDLVDRLVQLALERHSDRQQNSTER